MEYGLTYDSGSNTVGNLTGVTETGGATVDYEYDDLYRLTEETRSSPSYTRTYGYDLAGNPTTVNGSSVATFDAGNKLSTIQSKAVTHDVDGNITGIATTSPVTFKTIEWTALNKASRVYQTTGGGYIDYRYLHDGKRYYSKAATGVTSRMHYIFAGDTLIGEIAATVPSVAYTWGPDGLISKRNLSTSTSHWYEFGPQGETRTLRNSSGSSTDTYYYNAYGEQTSSTGSTVNPYRYGGKYGYYSEPYTGLVLATQRWYSPQLMRWVSRDPIGYDGGVNLYEYVGSRPTGGTDPSGLDTVVIIGGDTQGNPFGHVAIGFSGKGIYSYGTGTPPGYDIGHYLLDQSKRRNQWIYRIPTTPEQERRMLDYAGKYQDDLPEVPGGDSGDSCASRTNNVLRQGGFRYNPPDSPFPQITRDYLQYLHATGQASYSFFGRGSKAVPQILKKF